MCGIMDSVQWCNCDSVAAVTIRTSSVGTYITANKSMENSMEMKLESNNFTAKNCQKSITA